MRNVQDALKAALEELEATKAEDERDFIRQQIGELRARADQMMVVLKVRPLTLADSQVPFVYLPTQA